MIIIIILTDVAGGPSASIIEAMRGSLQVSNHLSLIKSKDHYLNLIDVFHMATLGGAKGVFFFLLTVCFCSNLK